MGVDGWFSGEGVRENREGARVCLCVFRWVGEIER